VANVLVTQCLNGITIGLIFALVALGLTIVLGLMGVLNFAHGSFYMLGGYITYSVFAAVGNFWLGLVACSGDRQGMEGAGTGAGGLRVTEYSLPLRRAA